MNALLKRRTLISMKEKERIEWVSQCVWTVEGEFKSFGFSLTEFWGLKIGFIQVSGITAHNAACTWHILTEKQKFNIKYV